MVINALVIVIPQIPWEQEVVEREVAEQEVAVEPAIPPALRERSVETVIVKPMLHNTVAPAAVVLRVPEEATVAEGEGLAAAPAEVDREGAVLLDLAMVALLVPIQAMAEVVITEPPALIAAAMNPIASPPNIPTNAPRSPNVVMKMASVQTARFTGWDVNK